MSKEDKKRKKEIKRQKRKIKKSGLEEKSKGAWDILTNLAPKKNTQEKVTQSISIADEMIDVFIEGDSSIDKKWYDMAKSFVSFNQFDKAIECYDNALKINPKNYLAWTDKGCVLGILGKHEEAIKCFNEALRIDPNHHEIWDNKINALEELGKFDEARTTFNEASKNPAVLKHYKKRIQDVIDGKAKHAWFE